MTEDRGGGVASPAGGELSSISREFIEEKKEGGEKEKSRKGKVKGKERSGQSLAG